jgi:hypothetical protein
MNQNLPNSDGVAREMAFGARLQQTFKTAIICLALVMTGACATIDSLEPGTGTDLTVKDRSYQEVWNAAIIAASSGLAIVEKDQNKGLIKAEAKVGLTTWGEVVGIFISPQAENSPEYSVEVQSLKRSKLQITGQDWELTIIERMKAELKI